MRKIIAIGWKDARVRFSSAGELLFFLILPLVFTFLLGGGIGSTPEADTRNRLLVVDEDGTVLAGEVITALEQSETVRPEVLPGEEAESEFEDRAASALLTIPAGFEAALLRGETAEVSLRREAGNSNSLVAQQAVLGVIQAIGRQLDVANASTAAAEEQRPFADGADRQAYFAASLNLARDLFESAPERMERTWAEETNVRIAGFSTPGLASAGQLITWVYIPLLGISQLLAIERTTGTLRRLLTTPTRKATFLLGTITGQLALAIVQMILLVAFGIWVMKLDWGHSPEALAVMLLSFGLASVAFGTMLGTFVKTSNQASGLSVALGMSMALLGGCWYPSELFPEFARNAVRVLPTTWAMEGLKDIVIRGEGLASVLPEAAVLLGFALVFFIVGVGRFRYE